MKQRIITGLIFGAIVLGLVFTNLWSRTIFLLLLGILISIEYTNITKFSKLEILASSMVVGLISIALFLQNVELKYVIILCITTNLLLAINLFIKNPFLKHDKFKSIILSTYIILPLIMAFLNQWHTSNNHLLISTLILVWVADSGAYFVGTRLGKRKILPRISPGKSWEGFLGAGMLTIIVGYLLSSIFNTGGLKYWLYISIVVWALGLIGDLIASHVKRIHQVKDSGGLLPGHGGFYDRFDAYIYVIPFVILTHQLYFI